MKPSKDRFLFCLLFVPLLSLASNVGDKVSITPISRVLMDAAAVSNSDTIKGGVYFYDVRLGVKGKVNDNYFFKLDIGFANNKVKAKDVYVGYRYKNHTIQAGQFYEPYSSDMLASTTDMRFPQVAGSTFAFGVSRRIGVLYNYDEKKYGLSAGVFSDGSNSEGQRGMNAWSLAGRVLYRPVYTNKEVLHISAAPSWRKIDGKLTIASVGVSSCEDVSVTKATLNDAKSQFKIGTEFLYMNQKISFQSEYKYSKVSRDAAPSYDVMGVYGQLSWMVFGPQYGYDTASSCTVRPQTKSLELVLRYDYLNQDDSNAGIKGGSFHDLSLGVNYYLNKNIAAKLSYSVLKPLSNLPINDNSTYSMLQSRLQFTF